MPKTFQCPRCAKPSLPLVLCESSQNEQKYNGTYICVTCLLEIDELSPEMEKRYQSKLRKSEQAKRNFAHV